MHGRGCFSRVLALLLALGVWQGAPAVSVPGGEEELAREVAAKVRDGVIEWMTVGSDRFPVIVREAARENAVGVVLIVPEPGAHADWPDVVRPLRLGLPAQGWQTVSLQMPRAGSDGDYVDPARAGARLGFALERLLAGDVTRIVVLAQGRAYRMVVTHLAETLAKPPQRVQGLVLVSPDPGPLAPGAPDPLVDTAMPLLELAGSEDRPVVQGLLREHARRAARGQLSARRAVVIDGAGGDYRAQSELLVRRVRGWLSRLPAAADDATQ